MTQEQVCGSSRYAQVICAIALLALLAFVAFVPSAHAQQSYRTQKGTHPSPVVSQPSTQTRASQAKPQAPRAGRFLGWRRAGTDGPQAVRYFRGLEQRSKRLPGQAYRCELSFMLQTTSTRCRVIHLRRARHPRLCPEYRCVLRFPLEHFLLEL